LAALLAAGAEIVFATGDELFREEDQFAYLWILLEGQVEVIRRVANEATVLFRMATPGQWAGGWGAWDEGALIGSRPLHPMQHPSNRLTGYAVTAGRLFRVPSEELGRLAGEWFPFGKHLLTGMYQNVWRNEAAARHRESLVALGDLAGRLAHEINNPAAATRQAVSSLRKTVSQLLGDAAEHTFAPEPRAAIDRLRGQLLELPAREDGALGAMEREDAVVVWLERRGVRQPWETAGTLTAAGADTHWLDQVEAVIGRDPLEPALRWISTAVTSEALLSELADATSRISDLVGAVKAYSQMERSPLHHVDIHASIEAALTTLGPALERVDVLRAFGPDVPFVDADAAELNTLWTCLIDNAIDAMAGGGTLVLASRVEGDTVVVEVTDNGPGMSLDVRTRAFEPFFTTKDVGKGAGLGLDMARRIVVEHHGGEITLDSGQWGTTAHVRLPVPR